MKKKVLICIFSILLLCGCDKGFKLDDEYYNEGKFIDITYDEYESLSSMNYILFTYNNYCNFSIPCDNIFKEVIEKYDIDILTMKYEEFKNTNLHETVLYAPSVIIVKDGKIVAFLDAEKDEDLEKYQNTKVFESWLKEYVDLKK